MNKYEKYMKDKYKKYMKEKRTFREGDKIKWTYKHYLNSKSYTLITKVGKYIRKIATPICNQDDKYEYCLVHFEGNKHPSRVLISEIEKTIAKNNLEK